MTQLTYWVANWNLSEGEAIVQLGGDHDYMVDTIGADAKPDLAFLVRSNIRKIAVYVTGPADVIWTAGEIAAYRLAGFTVVTIDQHNGPPVTVNVADVESGAKTIGEALDEAAVALDQGREFTIYVDQASLHLVTGAWAARGRPPGKIVAYQWASPTSNPDTIVAGDTTIRQANVDLSVTLADWHPVPPPPKPPAPVAVADRAIVTLNKDDVAIVDFDPAVRGWGIVRSGGPVTDQWEIRPTTPGKGRG